YLVTNGDHGITDTRFGRLAMPPADRPDAVRPGRDDPDAPALTARWIDGTPVQGEEHLREQLAGFVLRDPDFPRNLANRAWGWLMGRALVEPVDDLPDLAALGTPGVPEVESELLTALARFTVDHHH